MSSRLLHEHSLSPRCLPTLETTLLMLWSQPKWGEQRSLDGMSPGSPGERPEQAGAGQRATACRKQMGPKAL